MKKITNYKLHVTRIAFCLLLSAFCLITNAQTDENRILDSATIQKNELKMTSEIEEAVVTQLKNMPEEFYSHHGINKPQLENLHLGKPVPWYNIVNERLEPINPYSVAAGEPFSLRFEGVWNVPVMSDGEPLLFGIINFSTNNGAPRLVEVGIKNTIEHFHNYEYKDSVIGSIGVDIRNMGMTFLIIRKEHKDVFVEVYDKATGEYFKNEYDSGELITLLIDWAAKMKAKQSRYYDFVADKSELILTSELTEMLCTRAFSHIESCSDEALFSCGIKNRPKLENLHPGKPVPWYSIVNENLIFTGSWEVPIMSDGEPPFYVVTVILEDNGQYSNAGGGTANYEMLNNYKYKDLIIGYLRIGSTRFFIIRKDNKDIFVKSYDYETHEVSKTEYSLSEIINLLKK
ncbi:MAG: hypothetical protein FWC34_03715 [Bacteroidetes bacterium]|nr:hypothetical protein [Bacteroidota bacterium]MCL2302489.1 hypothetical protein [Lentimicrobiaceae bacterium]